MRISIAMCTYNGADYLPAQLDSIARQTVSPEEVVICDDGSTDTTLDIAQEFAQTVPFKIRIFKNKQNLGSTKNFEHAIRLCEGDLIALSDQDDIWHPQKLAVLSALFKQDNTIGGVFSDGDILQEDLQLTGRTLWRSFSFDQKEQRRFRSGKCADVLLRRNVVTGMTLMFRSALRDKLLPIPGSWVHDGWLAFMLILHSRLHPCPECLVGYRTHERQSLGPPLSTAEKVRSIAHHGVADILAGVRSRNLLEYERQIVQFDDLAAYLRNNMGQITASLLAPASAKAGHARAAIVALSHSKRQRFQGVVGRAGGYRRYSQLRLLAMCRDLII